MALTRQTNGNLPGNIIKASWFNDFLDLLSGVMPDQPVVINNSVVLKQITYTTPTAPTLALSGTGSLGAGAYTYAITFGMGFGQTLPGTTATITTVAGNSQVSLSSIPLGPVGTTYRAVYRSKVGTVSPLYAVHTIGDNTTTTYIDSTPDTSLTSPAAAHDKFGGYLAVQNQAGATNAEIFPDGNVSTSKLNLTSGGSIARLQQFTGANSAVITHNWGVVPDYIFVMYTGNFGSPPGQPIYTYSATTTSVNVSASNGYTWTALLIKY